MKIFALLVVAFMCAFLQGADVIVNIPALPTGKSIKVFFDATVNNPLPAGVVAISTQASVSSDSFAASLSDDPNTAAVLDATLFPVESAPGTNPGNGSLSVTAQPNPVNAGKPVTFSAPITLGNGVTLVWDFGDSSQDTSNNSKVSHTYSKLGVYDVTVTLTLAGGQPNVEHYTETVVAATEKITDQNGNGIPDKTDPDIDGDGFDNAFEIAHGSDPNNPLSVPAGGTGTNSDIDTDGDGFSDELELATGSNPLDVGSIPALATSAIKHTFGAQKIGIKLSFKAGGSDSISVTGVLPVATGFLFTTPVVVDVGGVVKQFTLAKNGRGKSGADTLNIITSRKNNAQGQKIGNMQLSLKKGTFADALKDEKLTAGAVKNSPRVITVNVIFNGELYTSIRTLTYTATATKGTAKNVK